MGALRSAALYGTIISMKYNRTEYRKSSGEENSSAMIHVQGGFSRNSGKSAIIIYYPQIRHINRYDIE